MNRFYFILRRAPTRFYSAQTANKAKSPLAILRKKTGLPIGKCREALTKHDEDLEQAESWLQAEAKREGWAKVEKLKDRSAHQGLIGMLIKRSSTDNQAMMVEVNCETDFVAKNERFKELVLSVTRASFQQKAAVLLQDTPMPVTDYLSKDILTSIQTMSDETLADQVAESVGQLGEKITISRGCSMSATHGRICGFVYNKISPPSSEIHLGTYGALLHLLPSEENSLSQEQLELGQQICQHAVGMDTSDSAVSGNNDPVSVLLDQSFIYDSSITVGELAENNGLNITKIIRYALGES